VVIQTLLLSVKNPEMKDIKVFYEFLNHPKSELFPHEKRLKIKHDPRLVEVPPSGSIDVIKEDLEYDAMPRSAKDRYLKGMSQKLKNFIFRPELRNDLSALFFTMRKCGSQSLGQYITPRFQPDAWNLWHAANFGGMENQTS